MKRIFVFWVSIMLPLLALGAASDVQISQKNASDTAWKMVTLSPVANSLLGFDASKGLVNVTIGSGVDLTANVLTGTGGGGSVANPTATIGLTAVNGVASSAIRSDGAPALSQAIAPTWTAAHIFTSAAPQITLGVNTTTAGKIKLFGSTSGDATITTPAAAGASTVVTLPNASSTLPIFGQQITFAGPTAARTVTFPDASFTAARTDAANTFTGVQTMTSPAITTSITTASTSFTAFAGATTLLTIGGTGAAASLFAPSTLDTTSSTTGAIRTSGGISAAKALNIGTTATIGTTMSVGGAATFTAAVPQIVLGANTTTKGGIKMFGNTSGDVTISPLAVAGTATALTFPSVSGGLIASATAIATVTGTPSSSNFLRGDGTWATPAGSGTVTVVASGSLTSTALVTGGGTTTLQTPSGTATMDSSGNISTPGTLTVGSGASTAGAVVLGQGTTQSTGTTNITLQAPTAVTSHIYTLPGTVGTNGAFWTQTTAGTTATLLNTKVVPSGVVVGDTDTQTLSSKSLTAATLTGVTTNSGTELLTGAAMGALAIDVTKENNTKSISTDSTFTFSAAGSTDQWFGMRIKNTDTAPHTLTWPASVYSIINQATAASSVIPASGTLYILWNYDGTVYNMYGDPSLVGTVISSSVATGSAVSLTTATAANVTSISLTPGAWQINGVIYFKPASATSSLFEGTIGTTTAAISTTVPQFTTFTYTTVTSSDILSQQLPTQTVTVATSTTYYLVARQTFSVGTSAAFGDLRAIRIK